MLPAVDPQGLSTMAFYRAQIVLGLRDEIGQSIGAMLPVDESPLCGPLQCGIPRA